MLMDASTALLYFLSALAQSAAGFAALVGLFGVFRLQMQREQIHDQYDLARHLLKIHSQVHESKLDGLPDIEVHKFLDDLKTRKYTYPYGDAVRQIHETLDVARKFTPQLIYAASSPLKWWAGIFVFCIALMPLSLSAFPVIVTVFTGLLAASVRALWKTGKFIQRWCLSFEGRATDEGR